MRLLMTLFKRRPGLLPAVFIFLVFNYSPARSAGPVYPQPPPPMPPMMPPMPGGPGMPPVLPMQPPGFPPFPAPGQPPVFPQTPTVGGVETLVSNLQTPTHLTVKNFNLFWTAAGDFPLQRISVNGGYPVPLAMKMGAPERIAVRDGRVYWVNGGKLHAADLKDGRSAGAAILSEGPASPGAAGMVFDGSNAYWVTSAGSASGWAIEKVALRGGDPEDLVRSRREIVSIAIDGENIYWEERGAGLRAPDGSAGSAIKKVSTSSKRGGGAVTVVDGGLNGLLPSLKSDQSAPGWLPAGGISVHNGEIFFADAGYGRKRSRLFKVPASGGAVSVMADLPEPAVAVASYGDNVYWADPVSINRIPSKGGKAAELAGGLNSPAAIAAGPGGVFWSETPCCPRGRTGPVKGSIKKVLAEGGKITTLAEGVDAPGPLALDSKNVYWGEGGLPGAAGSGRIASVPVEGGEITAAAEGISIDNAPIAVDNAYVYIADGSTVKRVPAVGGAVEKLAAGEAVIADIAADGFNVYWIEGPDSTVRKISAGGGPVTTLASGMGPAGRLIARSSDLYWVDRFDTIKKISVSGGVELIVAVNLQMVSDLASDSFSIYFLENGARDIKGVSVNGGFPRTLVRSIDPPGGIASDGRNLYWVDKTAVGKAPRAGGNPAFLTRGILSSGGVPNSIAVDDASVYWTEVFSGSIKKAPK